MLKDRTINKEIKEIKNGSDCFMYYKEIDGNATMIAFALNETAIINSYSLQLEETAKKMNISLEELFDKIKAFSQLKKQVKGDTVFPDLE